MLNDLPAPTNGGTANNLQVLQEFTNDTDKAGGKVDIQFSPRLSVFGRVGWRDADIFDQPTIPLPSGGGGNGETYVRNKQFSGGLTYTPERHVAARGALRLVEHRGRQESPALVRRPGAARPGLRHHRPADRPARRGRPADAAHHRLLGPRPPGDQPAVAVPDGATTRRSTTRGCSGRHSLKTGYEFQHIKTEVQDVNPLYGRDQYTGQFTRPAGAAANNLYNLADFMFGLRSTYALSNILVANLRQNMHFLYLQDDWRVNDRLTLNLGLRYEYATPWAKQDNILSNFDPATRSMVMATDGSLEDRSTINPDRNNFGPRLGFAYTRHPDDRRARRLRHQLRALQPRRRRQRAADQRPAGDQRGRRCRPPTQADFRTTAAGLSGRA